MLRTACHTFANGCVFTPYYARRAQYKARSHSCAYVDAYRLNARARTILYVLFLVRYKCLLILYIYHVLQVGYHEYYYYDTYHVRTYERIYASSTMSRHRSAETQCWRRRYVRTCVVRIVCNAHARVMEDEALGSDGFAGVIR